MMSLIKFIIFLVGLVTITYFALPYFGYEFNVKYILESKEKCEERIKECKEELILKGIENPDCNPMQCVDKNLIIKKIDK